MIRLILALVLILGTALPAAAQGVGEARRQWFEVEITPKSLNERGTWVGGQIVIDIKLISSDPFKRARLQMPKIEGARIEALARPHTLQINMLGGRGYSHQARYAIFPQVDGTLVIPPISVTGLLQNRTGVSAEFTETYPEQRITVHPPDPALPAGSWVVSHFVRMEETWSTDVNQLESGQTVRRTVKLTVDGARANDLPPMEMAGGDGYRILHTETQTETTKGSTGYTATVEQSWDVFIGTDDVFYVAPVKFLFWDPVSGEAKVIQAKPRRVEPVRRNADALRASLRQDVEDDLFVKKAGVVALIAIPILGLVVFLILAASSALPTRADFRLWRAARRGGAPITFYDDFQAWARRSVADRAIVGEHHLARLGPKAAGDVSALHRGLFGENGQTVEPRPFSRRLIGASIRMRMRRFRTAFTDRLWRLLFGG